jgi:hypothetical protein
MRLSGRASANVLDHPAGVLEQASVVRAHRDERLLRIADRREPARRVGRGQTAAVVLVEAQGGHEAVLARLGDRRRV